MPNRRILILVLTLLAGGGSWAFTVAYGMRIRSESYRREVEEKLAAFFKLPCAVASIRGDTFSSRAFQDVQIFLPDRRDRVFHCERAIWREGENDGEPLNELELYRGQLVLGTDRWLQTDYRRVFESGLGHDFEALNLSHVTLDDFELAFERGGLSIRCRRANGKVDLGAEDAGIARLNAYELNGLPVDDGVRILAKFRPSNGVEISELVLTLPEVPLATLSLGPAVGGDISQGRFSGQVQYLRPGDIATAEVWIGGELLDASLAELTGRIPYGPFQGNLAVGVEAARFKGGLITHFEGRGRLWDVTFSNLAPLLGVAQLSGRADVNLDRIDIAEGRVRRLRLAGVVSDARLEELLQMWGQGSATGRLSLRISNLDVTDDVIRSADIEIRAVPPPGEKGTIDRSLLLGVAQKALSFTWPASIPQSILPERLEYAEFGMRLLVRDNQLRILGTHGASDDTILTVVIFGQPLGLIKEQAGAIDLGPYVRMALERIRTYDPHRLREWWKRPTP
jgi:hypothetical protein